MARGTTEEHLESRERSVQDNLALMRWYFDLLYTKDLDAMLELVDDDIEWLVVPTGDVIRGKASLAELAENHWGASPDRTKKLVDLFHFKNGKIDRVHEYFDMDTVKRITRFAATADQQTS